MIPATFSQRQLYEDWGLVRRLIQRFLADGRPPRFLRFGRIDRSVGEPPCALRCRRTGARDARVGSDDKASSSPAVEANRPLKATLVPQTAPVKGGAAAIRGEGTVTLASCSYDRGRILSAGRRVRGLRTEAHCPRGPKASRASFAAPSEPRKGPGLDNGDGSGPLSPLRYCSSPARALIAPQAALEIRAVEHQRGRRETGDWAHGRRQKRGASIPALGHVDGIPRGRCACRRYWGIVQRK
jgi:hypothetical protein